MQVAEALEHLKKDLQRYADSGKARPQIIEFKQRVLNALIENHNNIDAVEMERDEMAYQCNRLKNRVDLLRDFCLVQGLMVDAVDATIPPRTYVDRTFGEPQLIQIPEEPIIPYDFYRKQANKVKRELEQQWLDFRKDNRRKLKDLGYSASAYRLSIAEFTGKMPQKKVMGQ